MLNTVHTYGISCFLPDPRARVEAKVGVWAGKEGINRKERSIYISCTCIFPTDEFIPAHLFQRCIFNQDARETIPNPSHLSIDASGASGHRSEASPNSRAKPSRTARSPLAQGSRYVGPGSTIAPQARQPYGSATARRHVASHQTRQDGQEASGSFRGIGRGRPRRERSGTKRDSVGRVKPAPSRAQPHGRNRHAN